MEPSRSTRSVSVSLAIIAAITGALAAAFAYTAGWVSPARITPAKLVRALQGPTGPALGHRRNHAKGICFTGVFESNGNASGVSKAMVFHRGEYPLVGRFNIGGPDPRTPDPMAQVRGFSTRITTPDGEQWRGAAIDAPFFAAKTPQDFYAFLSAVSNPNPDVFKRYSSAHPEILTFIGWVKGHARTQSWAEDRFNSLDSFLLVDSTGAKHVVRWSFIPEARSVELSPQALAQLPPDFLERDITQRAAEHPLHWDLIITLADAGDPTEDPTRAWPSNRQTIDAGTVIVKQVEQEANGPCRDINFDPSVLPSGITTSDDPFPAARSAAYRVSYDSRTSEESHYPHSAGGVRQ